MKGKALRRYLSAALAVLVSAAMLLSLGNVVHAAVEVQACFLQFPQKNDVHYSQTTWGHPAVQLMGGWRYKEKGHTTVHSIGSTSGQVAYCIEPGAPLRAGDMLPGHDESFWDQYPDDLNVTISPLEIKVFLGRIMQYGYQGNVSASWLSQNSEDAARISHIVATQLLVWETIVGERDSAFNKVDPSAYGKGAVLEYVRSDHPLRSQILSYYNSMVTSIKNHTTIPSFCSPTWSTADPIEMKWNGTKYSVTLTDTNKVLSNYVFSSTHPGLNFVKNGDQLTISSETATVESIQVSVSKASNTRSGVVTWADGNLGSTGIQDMITYGETVSDPVNACLLLNMEAVGTMRLVKTSEDDVISGIPFTITGSGVSKTVVTGKDGTIDIAGLLAGTYTVTEAEIDRYTPQSVQQVTIAGGQISTVAFKNTLKRGALEVIKSAEDGYVEGVKFHLFGVSLSGLEVNEYAVTNSRGVARFENIPISGARQYTIEEVDTAVRYVVPSMQQASIQWNKITERSFANVLKKFIVTVTKTDVEANQAQGGATLANAKYGVYKGGDLVDVYYTDANGQFTSCEYICDNDWTVREIEPSEGYLLDPTVYKIGASPKLYSLEHNVTSVRVTEAVIKGSIRLIKHIDAEDPNVEITEPQPEPSPIQTEEPVLRAEQTGLHENEQEVLSSDEPEHLASPSPTENTEEYTSTEQFLDKEETDFPEHTETGDASHGNPSEADPTDEDPSPEEADASDSGTAILIPVDNLRASGNEGIIEQPEEGAVFQIYLSVAGSYSAAKESERDLLTTDSDGVAVSKDLPFGRYTVHQVEGKDGLAFIPDFTVYIHEHGHLYSYILNNQTITSLIRVEKRDAETGNIIPAAGIGFQVRDMASGDLIAQDIYYPTPMTLTTFYTADDGTLMLPCELPYGAYELLEVETCYGYVLDEDPVPFVVDGDTHVVVVTKYNMPQKGVIQVRKTGEVFSSVTSDSGIYQPVYSIEGLANATYTIRALEDIYTLDGTLRASSGELLDTISTGSDGIAKSGELYLGKYVITETQAPFGMVLNRESQTVELVYAGQEIELAETAADFYNQRQQVTITLNKSMETDTAFGIGTDGEIFHVTFGLYAEETLKAADGASIPADGLLEIVSLGADGSATCKTDLPFGNYYLQELETDSHYLVSDTKYAINFSYAGEDIQTVKLAANNGEPIVNKLLYGSVLGLKKDEDGRPLAGALIGLFSPSVTTFSKETALMTVTTTDDGVFRFKAVPVGNWVVRELEQPEGYVLCTRLFPVSLIENEQVIEIEIVNEWIRGNLMLTKYDADYPGNRLTGAVFEVYRDTNGNKVLDKSDELLGVMDEPSKGMYWMRDVRYGGVFVKEK